MASAGLYLDDNAFPNRPPWYARPVTWVGVVIVVAVCIVAMSRSCRKRGEAESSEAPVATNVTERVMERTPPRRAEPSVFGGIRNPTGVDIARAPLSAFVPTRPDEPRTAVWGAWRVGSDNRPRFHGAVDIAPLRKDRSGKALDEVMAVADGKVAYINRQGGDSQYGIHVIVEHADLVGPVYTLYGHLATVTPSLTVGGAVTAGAALGIIGHTSSQRIAPQNAHLHFEVALMHTSRFGAWGRARKLIPDRGNHHGWNLYTVDPRDFYQFMQAFPDSNFRDYVQQVPVAFELIVLSEKKPLDYFTRYPSLWKGTAGYTGPLVISVTEAGVITSGRPADTAEIEMLVRNRRLPTVLKVNDWLLERNGQRIVVKNGQTWEVGKGDVAKRWLELLTYE